MLEILVRRVMQVPLGMRVMLAQVAPVVRAVLPVEEDQVAPVGQVELEVMVVPVDRVGRAAMVVRVGILV
jgi:hypothetical protein